MSSFQRTGMCCGLLERRLHGNGELSEVVCLRGSNGYPLHAGITGSIKNTSNPQCGPHDTDPGIRKAFARANSATGWMSTCADSDCVLESGDAFALQDLPCANEALARLVTAQCILLELKRKPQQPRYGSVSSQKHWWCRLE